jgi:hypothetical protein
MSPIAPSNPSILGSSYLNFTGTQPSSTFTGIAGPRTLSQEDQYKKYYDRMYAKARAQRDAAESLDPVLKNIREQRQKTALDAWNAENVPGSAADIKRKNTKLEPGQQWFYNFSDYINAAKFYQPSNYGYNF